VDETPQATKGRTVVVLFVPVSLRCLTRAITTSNPKQQIQKNFADRPSHGSSSAYYALFMKKRTRFLRRLRGYSLVEMLVVVGMIGIFSLITVPPILSYMGQIRVRSATRVLNGDLRAARQRAITRNNPVAFSFLPGDVEPDTALEKAKYVIYDRGARIPDTNPAQFQWVQVGQPKYLEGVYFLESDFPLNDAVDDDMRDIIFRPNGTIANMDVPGNPVDPAVVAIRTERDVMNNRVTDTYTIAGSFTTTLTTD
jgi:prepilin-type N-terminal cleavage/methylation domain-containing protein